jgi:AcrR family transcriptional regulator
VSSEPGLRERKKQRTRRLIAETARELFAERGFDAVTVAEVARAAEVSEGTVFNYFPTKEQLFYGEMEHFETRLVDAVRSRAVGESPLLAFRRVIVEGGDRLAQDEVADLIAAAGRIVEASPALQAREREIVAEHTGQLAELLASERGTAPHDVDAEVVAGTLMTVHRVLVEDVRRAVLEGTRGTALAERLRRNAEQAFDRIEHGLGQPGTA